MILSNSLLAEYPRLATFHPRRWPHLWPHRPGSKPFEWISDIQLFALPGYSPPITRTVLPALIQFAFHGVSKYFEVFVAQIDTPRLEDLHARYYNWLDFQFLRHSQFLHRQETLNPARLYDAELYFSHRDSVASINISSSHQLESPSQGPGLNLDIVSEVLDRQASHLAQVLRQFLVVLSDVDHLDVSNAYAAPGQHEGMDDTGWLELLSLFTAVRSLMLPENIARQITRALDATASETVLATAVLPALRLLHIWHWRPAVTQFTSLRRLSCRPIAIVNRGEFDRLRSLLAKEEKVPDELPT